MKCSTGVQGEEEYAVTVERYAERRFCSSRGCGIYPVYLSLSSRGRRGRSEAMTCAAPLSGITSGAVNCRTLGSSIITGPAIK